MADSGPSIPAMADLWPGLRLDTSSQDFVWPLAPESLLLLVVVEEVVAFPGQNGVCQLNRPTGALLDHMTRLSAEDFMHSSL